jgi:hypothetical protein
MMLACLHFGFLRTIFSAGVIALWYAYAFWIGLLVAVGAALASRGRARCAWLLMPVLWMGLEYFPSELIKKHPETQLVVLSEYTFTDVVRPKVQPWCRRNQRYLIVGGEEPAPGSKFYNMSFVIDPHGEILSS